jgi:hypothetical protein
MAQFKPVDCSRGAPMGRSSYGEASRCPDSSVFLFKVHFVDGDYDDGGAYWGGGIGGGILYCARGPEYRAFARAHGRAHAARMLGIPGAKLARIKADGL